MTWKATTALLLNYGRPRLTMQELSEVLGISITYINNVAASGGLPVKTSVEGGRRWADVRDVGEYLRASGDALKKQATPIDDVTISVFDHIEDLTREQVVVLSESLRNKQSGIYFLINDEEIVYIGQSTDVQGRILRHRSSADMREKFNRVTVISCSSELLEVTEAQLIAKFSPRLNIAKKPK